MDSEDKTLPTPQYQAKNWVIPLEIVHYYEILHDLTIEEFVMVSRIESLVRYGKGCFASNKWLAERQGCKIRQVQLILQSLKSKKMIFIKMKGQTRYITTKWSPKVRLRKKK